MFADLVGSTALAERLGPEELKLIVGEAVARMIGAVEAFGGTVKDLAGDGVLALFGAPTAHEDDPERAVRAALRVVDEIAAYAGEVERALGRRAGSASASASTPGRSSSGRSAPGAASSTRRSATPVNTAARLQSLAEPGTVLVGEATHRLVAPVFAWSEPRELELKGKAEPVTAYRVDGVPRGARRTRASSRRPGAPGRPRTRARHRRRGASTRRSPAPAGSCS